MELNKKIRGIGEEREGEEGIIDRISEFLKSEPDCMRHKKRSNL